MAYLDFEGEERFQAAWTPTIDVYERTDAIVIRVELPGVEKSDIRLRWRDRVLEITGIKRRQPSEGDSCRYLCVERQHGRFRRDVAINAVVNFKEAVADLRDGVLKIRLPKRVGPDDGISIPIDG